MRASRRSSGKWNADSSRASKKMENEVISLEIYQRKLQKLNSIKIVGSVKRAAGLVVESLGAPLSVGELCEIVGKAGDKGIPAEVIGFRDNYVLSMPLFKV